MHTTPPPTLPLSEVVAMNGQLIEMGTGSIGSMSLSFSHIPVQAINVICVAAAIGREAKALSFIEISALSLGLSHLVPPPLPPTASFDPFRMVVARHPPHSSAWSVYSDFVFLSPPSAGCGSRSDGGAFQRQSRWTDPHADPN